MSQKGQNVAKEESGNAWRLCDCLFVYKIVHNNGWLLLKFVLIVNTNYAASEYRSHKNDL